MSFESKEKEPELRIVEETEDDQKGTREVFDACWRITYPNEEAGITKDDIEALIAQRHTPEGIASAKAWREGEGKDEIRIVAKRGNTIVGVCRFSKGEDSENVLRALYVSPQEQGRGVGTKLWQEAYERMNKNEDVILHVAAYNDQAIGFYEGLGFQRTDEVMESPRFMMKSGSNIPQLKMILLAHHDRT